MRSPIVNELRARPADMLCMQAADEIDRLLVVIDSYAKSSAAAMARISQLQDQVDAARVREVA